MKRNKRIIQKENRRTSFFSKACKEKINSQGGYALPFVLIFLTCTLLGNGFLLQNMSDGIQWEQNRTRQFQSRWMAESGWNAAIARLELGDMPESIYGEYEEGSFQARIAYDGNDLFTITAEGKAGEHHAQITGVVRWLPLEENGDPVSGEENEIGTDTEEVPIIRELELVSRSF